MGSEFSEAVEAFRRGELDRARALAELDLGATASPQAHHLLGLVHCRLGDPASGVPHLALAAEADPDNAAFRIMLARAMVDAGRAAEVLAMPEPPEIRSAAALELWRTRGEAAEAAGDTSAGITAWTKVAAALPRDWRAWANLGNASAAEERWSEAADALSKAAALNPDEVTLRANAGLALVCANRVHDALPHLRSAAAGQPENADIHVFLASALAALREPDEAIGEFEKARRIAGPTVATELGIGRLLSAKTRHGEAEAALEEAYRLEPTNRSVVHHYGLVLERNNKLEALAALLDEAAANGLDENELNYLWAVLARRNGRLEEAHDLLLRSAPDEDDPVAWYHLKAKIADALGKPAEAFEAAAAMNRTALEVEIPPEDRDDWRAKAIAYREEQHALARGITREWATRVPLVNEPAPRRIAFLVGFPRSGTTLLDTFLMGHPEITVLEEEQLVGKAALGLKVKDLPSTPVDVVRKARRAYLDALSQRVGDDFTGVVVDKFPLDMAAAPLIQAMFPGAPIIFAQRHPCDVVLSGFMQTFGMVNFGSIADAADYYDAMMSTWIASRDTMKLNSETVVYEQLIEDPEAVLRHVVAFLGLPWDAQVLDHQRSARERGTIATPSYDQVTQPISKSASGRWKRYREQMEPALPLLLSWAERLGYSD